MEDFREDQQRVTAPAPATPPIARPKLGVIIGQILAVVGVFAAWLNTLGRAVGAFAVILALALLIRETTLLRRDMSMLRFLIALFVFLLTASLFLWFGFLESATDTDELRNRIRQYEQVNLSLKRENTQLRQQAATQQAAQKLIEFMGDNLAQNCSIAVSAAFFAGEQAALECREPSLEGPSAATFQTTQAMNTDFVDAVRTSGGNPVGDERNCIEGRPGQGVWKATNSLPGDVTGRLACYIDSQKQSTILWTYADRNIYFIAWRKDQDITALYSWWNKYWATKS